MWHCFNQLYYKLTLLLSEQLNSLSCTRSEAPWAITPSRSISPNRTPPPHFRPLIGCLVMVSTGPVLRTYMKKQHQNVILRKKHTIENNLKNIHKTKTIKLPKDNTEHTNQNCCGISRNRGSLSICKSISKSNLSIQAYETGDSNNTITSLDLNEFYPKRIKK